MLNLEIQNIKRSSFAVVCKYTYWFFRLTYKKLDIIHELQYKCICNDKNTYIQFIKYNSKI